MEPFPFTIPGIPDPHLPILRNVKDYEQYVATVNKLVMGKCPFCPVGPPNKIIFQTSCWVAFHSIFPQKHQSAHIVIAHREHLGHLRDLTQEDWRDFHEMNQWVCEHCDIPGGGLGMRFGPVEYNIASVPDHLHWNIQVPDGSGVVALWLAKNEKEIGEADERAIVFETLRLGTNYGALSEENKAVIKGRYPKLEGT